MEIWAFFSMIFGVIIGSIIYVIIQIIDIYKQKKGTNQNLINKENEK